MPLDRIPLAFQSGARARAVTSRPARTSRRDPALECFATPFVDAATDCPVSQNTGACSE